jgi:hypothetical protein
VRFFAGIPLLGPGGLVLGSLCLVGREPQQPTDAQCSAFTELAGVRLLCNAVSCSWGATYSTAVAMSRANCVASHGQQCQVLSYTLLLEPCMVSS